MYKPYITPALVLGENLRSHLLAHATPQPDEPSFYTVHTPLHVFKKARKNGPSYGCVLINLIIPVGETVYAYEGAWLSVAGDSYRKMRASKAEVHSIIDPDTRREVATAKSDYSYWFKYHKGKTVTPDLFSRQDQVCAGGIHFFLNVGDALDYRF